MNQFSSDSSFNTKKKNSRSKYNKLTKEQKLEIIREWDRSRLSAASIATKFSMMWGMKLSSRGVADIISFWKENGKVRGFSQDNPIHLNVYNELHQVCQFCLRNDYPISKQDFKSMIQFIQQRDNLHIESYEMVWFDYSCECFANELEKHSHSVDSSSITHLSSLLSQYQSSVLALDFHPFLFNTYNSPLVLWSVLSSSSNQSIPAIFDVSSGYPSPIQFASLLEKLDSQLTEPTLVLLCDCCGYVRECSNTNDGQLVLLDTPSEQPLSIALHSIHLHIVPRLIASSVLPSYRGVSLLFRILFKIILLTSNHPSGEWIQHQFNEYVHRLPISQCWGFHSESLHYESFDEVFKSEVLEVQYLCQQYHQAFSSHGEEIKYEEKEYLLLDESILSTGIAGLTCQIQHLCSDGLQLPVESANTDQLHKASNEQFSFFMDLYGDLIANLPDVTSDDFSRMKSFSEKICNANVL